MVEKKFEDSFPDMIDNLTEQGVFQRAGNGRVYCEKGSNMIYILQKEPRFTPNPDNYHVLVRDVSPGMSVVGKDGIGGGFG